MLLVDALAGVPGDALGILRSAEQMIGVVERQEAFGMARRDIDFGGILDADRIVEWGVHHE